MKKPPLSLFALVFLCCAVRLAVAAPKSPPKNGDACADKKPLLEGTAVARYEDGGKLAAVEFGYFDCEWFGRNDYLPPYEERTLLSDKGYKLVIVTDEDAGESQVIVIKNGRYGATLSSLDHATLRRLGTATVTGEAPGLGKVSVTFTPAQLASAPAR